ncbi:MAG: hypothetical protein MZV70_01110 [Desulfobacterales bacterium]|nr:hypothetical protein [Desulfobacterales bacterium]
MLVKAGTSILHRHCARVSSRYLHCSLTSFCPFSSIPMRSRVQSREGPARGERRAGQLQKPHRLGLPPLPEPVRHTGAHQHPRRGRGIDPRGHCRPKNPSPSVRQNPNTLSRVLTVLSSASISPKRTKNLRRVTPRRRNSAMCSVSCPPRVPRASLSISDGDIELYRTKKRLVALRDMDADLRPPPEYPTIRLSCKPLNRQDMAVTGPRMNARSDLSAGRAPVGRRWTSPITICRKIISRQAAVEVGGATGDMEVKSQLQKGMQGGHSGHHGEEASPRSV